MTPIKIDTDTQIDFLKKINAHIFEDKYYPDFKDLEKLDKIRQEIKDTISNPPYYKVELYTQFSEIESLITKLKNYYKL